MKMHIPNQMDALIVNKDCSMSVEKVPIPEPFTDESILIKVEAVAANPIDSKFLDFGLGPPGAIVGCDASGVIVQMGRNEEESEAITSKYGYELGDFVTGMVHGMSASHPENGAFANYCWLDAGASSKFMPATSDGFAKDKKLGDHISGNEKIDCFEKAASLPVSLYTATMILVMNLHMKLDFEREDWQDSNSTLLIYGAGTAFAQNLLQVNNLAKAFKNIVTVSAKSHNQSLREMGVLENFDYRDTGFEEKIVQNYPNIQNIVDCVSNEATYNIAYRIAIGVATNNKMQVNLVNLTGMTSEAIDEMQRDDSKVTNSTTNLFLPKGRSMTYKPQENVYDKNYRDSALRSISKLNKVIANGDIRCLPIKINEKKGFEGVMDAMDGIRAGEHRGEKFLIRF